MEFDNKNKGVLFVNNKKTSERHPDYTGEIYVGDKKMRIAAWEKKSKKGSTFLSLAISEFNQDNAAQKSSEQENNKFKDDEIPF